MSSHIAGLLLKSARGLLIWVAFVQTGITLGYLCILGFYHFKSIKSFKYLWPVSIEFRDVILILLIYSVITSAFLFIYYFSYHRIRLRIIIAVMLFLTSTANISNYWSTSIEWLAITGFVLAALSLVEITLYVRSSNQATMT